MKFILKIFFHSIRGYRKKINSFFTRKRTKKEYNALFLRFLLIITLSIFIMLKFKSVQRLIVLLLFVALNFAFAYIKRMMPTAFVRKYLYGLELVFICTLATSVALGPSYGVIMGPLLMIVNYLAERRPSDYFIVTILLYSLIGYFAYFFRHMDFFTLGIIIVILYNFFSFILSKALGGNLQSLIVFVIVNITSNIILLSMYGKLFVNLLT